MGMLRSVSWCAISAGMCAVRAALGEWICFTPWKRPSVALWDIEGHRASSRTQPSNSGQQKGKRLRSYCLPIATHKHHETGVSS